VCHWDVTRRVADSSGTRTDVASCVAGFLADCVVAGAIIAASDAEVAAAADPLECGGVKLEVVWLEPMASVALATDVRSNAVPIPSGEASDWPVGLWNDGHASNASSVPA